MTPTVLAVSSRAPVFALAGLWPALGAIALAQAAPTPVAPAKAEPAPIELSVFEVRSGDDVGYQAGNTASGSRLNARLKDTPASISSFTPEFLSDVAATNLSEMLAYATAR